MVGLHINVSRIWPTNEKKNDTSFPGNKLEIGMFANLHIFEKRLFYNKQHQGDHIAPIDLNPFIYPVM